MKKVTETQLEGIKLISWQDQQLIEETVGIQGEDKEKSDALRGYLVQLWQEMIPDDNLRIQLGGMAAAWCDGYTAGRTILLSRGQETCPHSLKKTRKPHKRECSICWGELTKEGK